MNETLKAFRGFLIVRPLLPILAVVAISAACSPKPVVLPPTPKVVRETVTVRDPELDKRVARLELSLLARDAQVEDLQAKLEDARAEVVRTMAKLQSVASRAQAASSMAEAEVSLQTMKAAAGEEDPPEAVQVTRLVHQAATEFDKQNYGGALYLANQAKTVASSYRGRVAAAGRDSGRPGETSFAVPIKLVTTTRGNVRGGPGTGFPIVFAADSGTTLTGFSYADEWIRIADDGGRGGWIFRSLVSRP
ncbi:MAG TPA: SH3 domain-containing protein [Gemmatimonadaceae bacterium]|nr:SH3 domain-containing protein [Gemmatimonadaceae bacterium]